MIVTPRITALIGEHDAEARCRKLSVMRNLRLNVMVNTNDICEEVKMF